MQDKHAAIAPRPTLAANPTTGLPVGNLESTLIVVLLLVWVLLLYLPTSLSMISIWERSETFAHGYVVFPIFLYLLWRERKALANVERSRYWPALLGVAGAGAIWFIGEKVNAAVVSQMAMVAMIPFAVWAVLGTRVASALCIPLAFLFFAVPFGDFLVPRLMDWTADFTVAAIKASGVPVYREGNNLLIPSGRWSVVEACSGIRYLIASLMVGCLYAYLSYRSPVRRGLFIVASIVVPIIANWLRAYMIVMLGHLSGNRIAVGVDHLIYGWVFFGIVMALLFWVGSRWREDDLPVRATDAAPPPPPQTASPPARPWPMLLGVVALTAIWPALEAYQDRGASPANFELPRISANNGWTSGSRGLPDWRPDISGASAELRQSFAKDGRDVGLHIAFFRDQTKDAKAITSTNQLVNTSNVLWAQVGMDTVSATIEGKSFSARSAEFAGGPRRLAAWQWFWVDGHETSNEYLAKFYQVLSVLQGHGDPVAWVIAYTPADNGMASAVATLREFTVDMRGPINAMLRQAATP
jgi:exosortase A